MPANGEVVVNNLVKSYKELTAINNLDLSIEKGEIFGLLGPNGSGKTTLINCILQLLKYDEGEIYIFGEKMTPASYSIKQQIGLVPQQMAVYEELTVYENIDYFCGLYIKDNKKKRELVKEAIEFVELGDFIKMKPKKLSGGLQRRLNLACGVAHKPRLIFLDEPTVAVDPQSRNKILEGIKELNRAGSTIVYTTHYMEEVEAISTKLVILDHGKVLKEGTSEEIIEQSSVGETITAECNGLNEEILNKLRGDSLVVNVEYENNILTVRAREGDTYLLNLLAILDDNGIKPLSITSKRPTLNDVFLELTGKELRDHA